MKQIRVVDFVILAGIALVLATVDIEHQVLLTRNGWLIVAVLFALIAVGIGIARWSQWLDQRVESRSARAQNH